ncbi:23S rRNA (uracil(1939)-C(5))-methyltransferase RlmD [Agarivorans sp. Toyoura001]|uniref:23S rRNA (uracil(1939)-C(5))-methyltransferase RlmD n=1 Tax=Agarivorans sp. Toyoura001 TaxID=2283141 RepID=UPI0010DDD5FE|nr:23S rRNA (uracil(1939)-C(5))-methyltransferase RlmD [Agarivorans sp. Toyoura001]GDY24426.1 23S rRNA (uracil(1939)-C(5))-methyltransferase RlmD [Agarivorans sp. Toyoura001]
MAQFFKAKPKSNNVKALRGVEVLQLDHHLKGVVKANGQTFFVDDVLPGERIDILPASKSGPAKLLKRLSSSPQRIEPECEFYQRCGGCSAQHLGAAEQREYKQHAVAALISRLSGFTDLPKIETIYGNEWQYRRIARLSSWFDKTTGWQLGFRQKASKQLVAISACKVLIPQLSELIPALQLLVKAWPKTVGLGHIELIDCQPQTVCKIRLTKVPSEKLELQLKQFAELHNIGLQLHTEEQRWLVGSDAYYTLNEQQLNLAFMPGDFIQVNEAMNQQIVSTAIGWLQLNKSDVVLDLYSGIGNFSLAIAQQAQQVIAVEGVAAMSERVMFNAIRNDISNIQAFSGDLEQAETATVWENSAVTKVLLDPARAGAKLAITQVAKLSPSTVVYVSCNPATLARDAAVLKQAGYRLVKLALVDMFAHTEHVETMALFER